MAIPGIGSLVKIDEIEEWTVLSQIHGYWIFEEEINEHIPIILINGVWYRFGYQEHDVKLVTLKNSIIQEPKIGAQFQIQGKFYGKTELIKGVIIRDYVALILIEENWMLFLPIEELDIQILSEAHGQGDVFFWKDKNFIVERVILPNKLIGRSNKEVLKLVYKNNNWNLPVKFQEIPILTGVKTIDQKILLNLDADSLINFCQISPFVTDICNEDFWKNYLDLNPYPFYIPKFYKNTRLNPLVRTTNDISFKELFTESYKLSQHLKQFDLYLKNKQALKKILKRTKNYIKFIFSKNHIDVVRPYLTKSYNDIIGLIGETGAESGNREILKTLWESIYLREEQDTHFWSIFIKTNPEGADYLMWLGYPPNQHINLEIASVGNLDLLKHMIALGWQINEIPSNILYHDLDNSYIDTIKYLIEERRIKPNQPFIRQIFDIIFYYPQNSSKTEHHRFLLNYLSNLGYWSTNVMGIYQAIKENRADLLDFISKEPVNDLTNTNKNQYELFIRSAKDKPAVKAWFERHPWTK